MISQKPFLVRAIYDWILANEWTPYIQVAADYPGSQLPQDYVKDNQIVLNVRPEAVALFKMDHQWVQFRTRFSGQDFAVKFPIAAIMAVFSPDNGQGMQFELEPPPEEISESPKPPKKSHLRVVK